MDVKTTSFEKVKTLKKINVISSSVNNQNITLYGRQNDIIRIILYYFLF